MKKFLLGVVGLLALGMGAPASAAHMAVKARPPAPVLAPIYDWTGFYIGANGGWGQSNNCANFVSDLGTFGEACRGRSGGLFGGQSVIAGKPVSGCLAWKSRAIGRISQTCALA